MWIWAMTGLSLSLINRAPYNLLKTDIYATIPEIKAAYASLKDSPDYKDAPESKRKEIDAAFATLSVQSKRKQHDRKNSPPRKEKNPYINEKDPQPVKIRLPLPVEAALNGYNLSVLTLGDKACPKCGGTGFDSTNDKCGRCRGQGQINEIRDGKQVKVQCPACKGTKMKIATTKCPHCKGAKTISGEAVEKVIRIERGFPENSQILIPNLVDENIAEDAIFVFQTVESDGWSRKGTELFYKVAVSLEESILGVDRELQHLDGQPVRLKRPSVRNGEKVVVSGRGVPMANKPENRGNLNLQLSVRIDEKMSEQLRDRWEAYFRRYRM